MRLEEIKALEAKFWDGLTNESEEAALRELAARNKGVSATLEAYFLQMDAIKASEDEVIRFEPPVRRIPIYNWVAAASVLILISASLFWWNREATEELALSQSEKETVVLALNELGTNWNKRQQITQDQLNKVKYYPKSIRSKLKVEL